MLQVELQAHEQRFLNVLVTLYIPELEFGVTENIRCLCVPLNQDLVVHLLQFVGVLQDRLLLGAKQPGPVHGAVGELFPPDVDQEKLDHFPLDECEILGECRWVELDLIVLLGLVDGVSRGVEHGNDGHEEEDKDDLSYYDD